MNPIQWPGFSKADRGYLTQHQHEQIIKATQGQLGILSGFAGSGKTTALAWMLNKLPEDASIAVAAPTGKAGVRAEQVMQEKGIECQATTIHRLLRPTKIGHGDGNWGFHFSAARKLPFNVIIIDEAGMIGSGLMSSLLAAVKQGSIVLLVGDPAQLSPIQHGCPFLDMMEAGIPHGQLTEIHRNSGRIAQACGRIRNGEQWESSPKVDLELESPENFLHIECTGFSKIQRNIVGILSKLKDKGYDLRNDVQVICPLRKKGMLSVNDLNKILSPRINPNGRVVDKAAFRVGDKVICIKNGSRIEEELTAKLERLEANRLTGIHLTESDLEFIKFSQRHDLDLADEIHLPDDAKPEAYVANGEIGFIEDITRRHIFVKFTGNKNAIRFNRSDWKNHLQLASAISCHKAQGSQAKVIISVIDGSYGADMVCNRAYHYTALTRAEVLLITIGPKAVINKQCRVVDVQNRKTMLTKGIIEWRRKKLQGSESLNDLL
tara:strand:+ start:2010 stop:3485 length:1476 start_codon:yes stop_codon:yes gene_type:complete